METFLGYLSGIIVMISSIPYILNVWQKKITPNLFSFGIWTFIGFAILLTYGSAGAKHNIWPAVFGFTNPLSVTIIAIWKGERQWPSLLEIACVVLALISLGLWYVVKDVQEQSQWALYLSIAADACAAIPTIVDYNKNPENDRPVPWMLFATGYGIGIFAITDRLISNYILPIYMVLGSLLIAFPLARYRYRKNIPFSQWI